MKFTACPIPGVFVIDIEPLADDRGFFARTFCTAEFAAKGLARTFVQCSVSQNRRRGTLRGLHFQAAPKPEAKVVRCTMGRLFDVAVDTRRASPTFGRWFGVELSADNRRALYLPEGVAHGFQTLSDDCEVFYLISEMYHADLSVGVRWDDPAIGVAWPLPEQAILSPRDQGLPLLAEALPC